MKASNMNLVKNIGISKMLREEIDRALWDLRKAAEECPRDNFKCFNEKVSEIENSLADAVKFHEEYLKYHDAKGSVKSGVVK